MAVLLCATTVPAGPEWTGIELLAAAGEGVVLLSPREAGAHDMAAVQALLENQQIACVSGPPLPVWLDASDFERVLLVNPAAEGQALPVGENELLEALLAAGCESVEVLPPAALEELSQSWFSGRRVGQVFKPTQR